MPGTLWIPSSLAAFVCLPPVNFESDICTCPQKLKSAKAMDPNQRYQRAMKVLAASAKVGSTNLRRTAVRFGRSRSIMRVEAFLDIHRIKECLDQNCWTGRNSHNCLVLQLHSRQMCCTVLFPDLFLFGTLRPCSEISLNW